MSNLNNRLRCVVSGASDRMTAIESSYIISELTPSKEMDCLEWSWGMKYWSLNVTTRKNIQTISATLHSWFDRKDELKPAGWFWIPTNLEIINNMHLAYVGGFTIGEAANVRLDPDTFYAGRDNFHYRLIPLPGMSESWSVSRYTGDVTGRFDPSLVKHSVYPFQDLPVYDLSIPYHFIIVNTDKKLYQLYGVGEIDYGTDFPFLSRAETTMLGIIRNIYLAWMGATPNPGWLALSGDHRGGGGQTALQGQ